MDRATKQQVLDMVLRAEAETFGPMDDYVWIEGKDVAVGDIIVAIMPNHLNEIDTDEFCDEVVKVKRKHFITRTVGCSVVADDSKYRWGTKFHPWLLVEA